MASEKARICENCGESGKKFKKCSRCQSCWYCSKECQISHWPTHKSTCQPRDVPPSDSEPQESKLPPEPIQPPQESKLPPTKTKPTNTSVSRQASKPKTQDDHEQNAVEDQQPAVAPSPNSMSEAVSSFGVQAFALLLQLLLFMIRATAGTIRAFFMFFHTAVDSSLKHATNMIQPRVVAKRRYIGR
eukprot:TRINITY_DN8938_c0_g3_i1.p1 TRINITY_DN8938_c0_g3~~TRINITY_DN8938_c0_g3_i1.p1  ORF type:complete len:187 (-),score=19.87 TRINITY_DN8938_c0_g3_i1:50-610(-)